MVAKVVLVVFLISDQAGESTTRAFEQAALEVLGHDAKVEVEVVHEDPDDMFAIERAGAADGVIELSLNQHDTEARLHCYIARLERWVSRSIVFDAGDEAGERARMLGFAVASMFTPEVTDTEPEPSAANRTPSEPEPANNAPTTPAPKPTLAKVGPSDTNSSGVGVVDTGAKHEPSAGSPLGSLDFSAVLAMGIQGEAESIGAAAGLGLPVAGPLWLRASLAGRTGEIPAAQANTRQLNLGLGLAWSLFRAGVSPSFEAVLRGDLLGSWFEVGHLSADDPSVVRKSRWQFGADLVLGAGLGLTSNALLYAGGGLEAMLGKTDIYTHGELVAVVPPLRLVGEVGVRTRF